MNAFASLLSYFAPLSTLQREVRGVTTLLTPGSPLLGPNAAYLPTPDHRLLPLLRAWFVAQDAPPLVCAPAGTLGLEPAETLRVGTYVQAGTSGPLVIEQVSRLQMSTVAGVLAEAHGLPDWAGPLATTLARSLELPELRGAVLLLAYAGAEAVGTLLLHGGAAYLWGTLDPAVDRPLLAHAAELAGGEVLTSLTDRSPLALHGETEVIYGLLS